MEIISMVVIGVSVLAILVLVFGTFFTVEQQTNAVLERFGKFKCIAEPGLRVKIPFIDDVVARISLRILQLDVEIETKNQG